MDDNLCLEAYGFYFDTNNKWIHVLIGYIVRRTLFKQIVSFADLLVVELNCSFISKTTLWYVSTAQ